MCWSKSQQLASGRADSSICASSAGANGGGGAIGLQSGCSDLCIIRNNSFVENQAEANGGAVYLQVGLG